MAIKALLAMILLFGSAAYIATAFTLIIFALGSNQSRVGKRMTSGIIGLAMIWGFIYGVMYLVKYGWGAI